MSSNSRNTNTLARSLTENCTNTLPPLVLAGLRVFWLASVADSEMASSYSSNHPNKELFFFYLADPSCSDPSWWDLDLHHSPDWLQTVSPHNMSSQQQCAVRNQPLNQSVHTHTHTLHWFLLSIARQKNKQTKKGQFGVKPTPGNNPVGDEKSLTEAIFFPLQIESLFFTPVSLHSASCRASKTGLQL